MAPPPRFMQMVEASRDEAQLAVRLYNDPSEPRSFESFVVHMHLAWLYLLHAELTRDGVDYRYWRTEGRSRVARWAGLHRNTVSDMEEGRSTPDVITVFRVAKVLGVSSEILGDLSGQIGP